MPPIPLSAVTSLMLALDARAATTPDAREIAASIARVVDDEAPVFGAPLMDAAVLVETGYRESAWRTAAVGDHGRALCWAQIQRAPRAVLTDVDACTRIAYARLRESTRQCPSAPMALYVSGRCDRGRRLSAWRMREAVRIARAVDVQESAAVAERQTGGAP